MFADSWLVQISPSERWRGIVTQWTLAGNDAYLRYELAWALPVIALQWIVAWRELWRWRRLVIVVTTLCTLYLGACDGFALGHGIWRVDPSRTVGLYAGPLPLEELIFYGVTSLMASQGFILIAGYLRERGKLSD